ncbi:MAG TPA: YdeI/OmpD-associated family protein [Kiritimatiellia bacterium]|nr:YdeI/OmpD-associated family protein [Kiritimatiellia bacterium]HRZ12717.1 YdeI/OmpD-associated family protein [Kiritimatiellia bacterium]HSA18331.1 YdeI/OmpD-associated family protein [Kiritimatiellia bacterium]
MIGGAAGIEDEAVDFLEKTTPLARNEWICWIEDAKKEQTRLARIQRVRADLKKGKRRPCCWPGCPHRGGNRMTPADSYFSDMGLQ